MITSLELENYRGFQKHMLELKPTTLIVGRNNAGKSTIVEALRLVSIVANRYKSLGYREAPDWLEIPRNYYGVSPSLDNMEIRFETMFYGYSEPPTKITCIFSDNSSITIYLVDESKIHAVIRNSDGTIIQSKQQANQFQIPQVSIMPQVAPVQKEEIILSDEYVKRVMYSSIAPSHFRNQLNLFPDFFPEFQSIVAETWPGVEVKELIGMGKLYRQPLYLEIRNENFVAEIGSMGHGLQMWLQTMWFLTLAKESSTVILDEPDVYMHADLQRRLIRFIRNRFPQVLLTTHSVEMMSEVDPEEILVVDKHMLASQFTDSIPGVQKIVNSFGSVHNVSLTRMWNSKRAILVEGKDLKVLRQFQTLLFPHCVDSFDSIPNMSIGGWGGWSYAIGSSMFLKNAFGESITTYCVLDSDYHTSSEIADRYKEASERGVQLHVWSKKEIENFLIIPSVVQRLIQQGRAHRTDVPSIDELESQIQNLAYSLESEVFDNLSSQILIGNRSLGVVKANQVARDAIAKKKEQPSGLIDLVSGKTLLSKLSLWSQTEFGVSFGPNSILREMYRQEIHPEIAHVVTSIERGNNF